MEGSVKKRLPVEYEDFKKIIDNDRYYVDKTMLIYDLLCGSAKNTLIVRPDGFGKTLNFSMLRYFFDITEKENAYLFDRLEISEHYAELEEYRNAYPVIALSLGCHGRADEILTVKDVCREIMCQFKKYSFILEGDKVTTIYRARFQRILNCDEIEERIFIGSLKLLSECLKQYYNKKVIVLVDDYAGWISERCDSDRSEIIERFVNTLLEDVLKTNLALAFSVMTGCYGISNKSEITGLNNVKTYGTSNVRYSKYFGFVQQEAEDMLRYYGMEEACDRVKHNCYVLECGREELYKSSDIIQCVKTDIMMNESTENNKKSHSECSGDI